MLHKYNVNVTKLVTVNCRISDN